MDADKGMRILVADACEEDRDRISKELTEELSAEGPAFELTFVNNLVGLNDALETGGWNLVLLDDSMPAGPPEDFPEELSEDHPGQSLLQLVREKSPETPVVLLVDSLDREAAKSAVRTGVLDVLSRDNLQRLPIAVEKSRRSRSVDGSPAEAGLLEVMSHELRTPLNSMILLSELMMDDRAGSLDRRQLERAKGIHRTGNSLLELINDTLDHSRMAAGEMELHPGFIEPGEIVGKVVELFTPLAEGKNLDFTWSIDEGLPKWIRTDRLRLEQILRNLLSNAFKFTEKGRIRLSVFYDESESESEIEPDPKPEPYRLVFRVEDTGMGIPETLQEEIFDRFRQAGGRAGRCAGGTGLGLAISRRAAQLLGGNITLESREGRGSTFSLHLPVTGADSLPDPDSGPGEDLQPDRKPDSPADRGAGEDSVRDHRGDEGADGGADGGAKGGANERADGDAGPAK
ncbi:MAG: ATP-binding protein, partial [Terrimicrobiaceae bacterium]